MHALLSAKHAVVVFAVTRHDRHLRLYGHVEPEMVKKRRVVVVSPRRRFRSADDATAIVVPLSEVRPRIALPWHYPLPNRRYAGLNACWAKGDLVAHVCLARLDRIFHQGGWITPILTADDLCAVRRAVAAAIGLY
ncbi:MAG TPA: type II toxin-antitoxin system PemK/MazF family toxin [Candidatus Elarobacter sp.]|nr:type II toxin-antitoxin system PemK/MazF family toxin [Candidatus Elarobacter sp.]